MKKNGYPAKRILVDYGGAILVSVVVALIIRFMFLEAYRIPSFAMKPTLEAGDTIFVAKWPFGLKLPWSKDKITDGRDPRYGEIVVFSLPSIPNRDFVRRVVALPGDTVSIRQGKLILNGKETVLPSEKNSVCGEERLPGSQVYSVCWEPPVLESPAPVHVPKNHVYVIGDLRTLTPELKIQKSFGIVPISSIKAKAMWIWLSVEPAGHGDKTGLFSRIRFERMFQSVR